MFTNCTPTIDFIRHIVEENRRKNNRTKYPFYTSSIYRCCICNDPESDRCPVRASGDRRTRLLDISFPGDGCPTSPEGSLTKTLEIGLIGKFGEASNIRLLTPRTMLCCVPLLMTTEMLKLLISETISSVGREGEADKV